MNDSRILLRYSLGVVLAAAVATVIAYYFVDRPVAYLVHRQDFARLRVLKWLTYPPPVVQTWSPLVIVVLVLRRAWGTWQRWQLALLVACVSLIVADQFRLSLGGMFGRYWPETWHDNNPSLIGTGTYGFQPFCFGDDAGSFPSGHSARILAFATVFWLAIPRGRWLYAILAAPMLVALVGMNYHFVSDVLAGSALGALVAAWATQFAGLK